MRNVALILGIQGQDGSLLSKHLLERGYEVFGGARNLDPFSSWRLKSLGIYEQVQLRKYDILDKESLRKIITECTPSEIYMLAGNSKTYSSFYGPDGAISEAVHGVTDIFDLCVDLMPHVRIFIASSSEMFGSATPNSDGLITEDATCFPNNPYGLGKLCSFHLARQYRNFHNLHIVNGILFNHESTLRTKHFLTRKISYNLARLKVEGGEPLRLGNLNMERDWSSACDVVQGMHQSMLKIEGDDYIFASGKTTSVRSFLILAATAAGFEPILTGSGLEEKCRCKKTNQLLAEVSMKHFREIDTPGMAGDFTKARKLLGWEPTTSVAQIAHDMVAEDLQRWSLGEIAH
ncbi:GDP-mannose 4,6-dehydratase [Polynucleobacter sp.]|uniref:GDP-mannose 4,6-dehydratase n=1 Tax=Polynucleobacter sp. TaxID=2029855 RepID=UPI00273302A0|nr:GDP-mannose 4,6-dehydratase [Polynucleobacter sp.]MDP3122721.1 GDP-mannose 4,6-dehydratase [Polynucleobacter sp.]